MTQPSAPPTPPAKRARRTLERTCVGCGKKDELKHLLRIVLGPDGQVAFDLANHAFGRGAHVHPTPSCLDQAARRGLSRSFRTRVACDGDTLRAELERAAERRMEGLLNAAINLDPSCSAGRPSMPHSSTTSSISSSWLVMRPKPPWASGGGSHRQRTCCGLGNESQTGCRVGA